MSVIAAKTATRREELKQALDCWRSFVSAMEDQEKEVIDLLEDEIEEAKRKPKCSASRGNHRHRGTKEEAGAKAGQFAPKDFRGKGSSSIANDPKYAGKTCPDGRKARRGKARLVGGQERFKKNAPSCGRDDPSRKNKCSLPEETVKVPKAEDGLIPVEKFALALDRKQREIEKLKRSISVLKKKKQTKVSVKDFIAMTNALARAEKGKLGEPPKQS